jgi:putative Mg2+ transporter-C (MgtC) family protein
MTYTQFTIRLLVALFAGVLIGIEREWKKKPAGIRTNTMVSTGAALFVLLAFKIAEEAGLQTDVGRVIGQVVTGIGFLGAGIIFKDGGDIHGLTTAATIWCSAAIGCIAGAGYFVEAAIGTAAIIFVNFLLNPLDKWLEKRAKGKDGKEPKL